MIPCAALSTSLRWHALPPLWIIVLVILPLVLLTVRFFYRREAGRVGKRLRIAMGALRVAAILLVLGALFGPYVESIQGEYIKRHLILYVDTSRSMGIRESYQASPELADAIREAAGYPATADLGQRERLELVKDILGQDRAYLEELAERFHLHLYTFAGASAARFEARKGETPATTAERLLRQVPGMKANGAVTRIGTAIRDIERVFRAKNEPVAGVLLFTDGRHTGGAPSPVEQARLAAQGTRTPVQVYPVAIGDPAAAINIGVSRVDAPEVALAGDEVFFTVTVHARGLGGTSKTVEAFLVDANGKEIEKLPIEPPYFDLPADGEPPRKVSFRFTFRDPGRYNLKIGVPPEPNEAVQDDNYQRLVLRVVELKMRVLLVASKPNWSYRFVSEALLRAEKTIEANVLLLSAEPEWMQPSSEGLPSLPLFPQEQRELAQYDVIVFMDVDPSHPRIAPGGEVGRGKTLARLENWVKRGGGLVLQAGHDRNIPDLYTYPPLNALLPVIPPNLPEHRRAAIVGARYEKRYQLTPAGRNHPIMRILRDADDPEEFWNGRSGQDEYATYYYWYAPSERAKSSTSVLAVRRERGESRASSDRSDPLIALQDYGLGKVLWLATDELWRMRRRVENLYYWRFWSNIVRHLATYRLLSGNKRIKIWVDRADARYQVGDSVGIEAKFLDENFEPAVPSEDDPATMTRQLKLRTPAGDEEEITVHAVLTDPPEGLFSAKLAAGRPGTYSLLAEPEDREEELAETTFVVEETTVEMSDPLLDMATLRAIAEKAGTRVLQPQEFRQLIEKEIVPQAGILRSGEPQRTDLWDRGWLLLLVVGLLAAEWILRRTNLLL